MLCIALNMHNSKHLSRIRADIVAAKLPRLTQKVVLFLVLAAGSGNLECLFLAQVVLLIDY
jgi:hypothetical protein